ncbi:MAG: NADH-quinone oxidoreductase subunit C, partial [Bacteroidales bacterium]|nr:NADH-quinone oxidoreductase subunit C [Bacteroidales bacterium]
MLDQVIDRLAKHFTTGVVSMAGPGLCFITVPRQEALGAIAFLKEQEGFCHLVLLTAVDYIEQGEFQLTYLLHHPVKKVDAGIRVMIERDNASMLSAHELWPTMATYQRELREMFGIDFPGSPGVMDDFILEGWQGIPPYRREFDTKAFAESFYPQREGRET